MDRLTDISGIEISPPTVEELPDYASFENIPSDDMTDEVLAQLIEQHEREEHSRKEAQRNARLDMEAASKLAGSVFDSPSFSEYTAARAVPYEDCFDVRGARASSDDDVKYNLINLDSSITEVKDTVEKIYNDVENTSAEVFSHSDALNSLTATCDHIAEKLAEQTSEAATANEQFIAQLDNVENKLASVESRLTKLEETCAEILALLRK